MKKLLLILNYLLFVSLPYAQDKPNSNLYVVSKDGKGHYTSIQSALDNIPKNHKGFFIIFIKDGDYNEKVFVEKSNLIITGESRDRTKIEFAELRKNWKENHPDDYGSAVINIKENVNDIIFKSLTIINNYGELYGDHDHAFTIRGFEGVTRIILDDCSVISDGGDALSLWNTNDGMYYHNNCYFEGWVDYVCPRGYCLIENSSFYGHNLTASIWHDGSKNVDQKFVIKNSRFDGVENFPLGRFHRDAQFYLIDCTFSSNLADRQIFFAPSNPPRILKWGENRIFYANCKVDGKNYSWMKDNLDKAIPKVDKKDINANWIFRERWDPIEQLEIASKELKKLSSE